MHHSVWLCRIAITPGLLLAVVLMVMATAPLSASQTTPLAAPQGEVLLKVTGNIAVANSGNELHLDREQLMAIDPRAVETSTPWTDGVKVQKRVEIKACGGFGDRKVGFGTIHQQLRRPSRMIILFFLGGVL